MSGGTGGLILTCADFPDCNEKTASKLAAIYAHPVEVLKGWGGAQCVDMRRRTSRPRRLRDARSAAAVGPGLEAGSGVHGPGDRRALIAQ